MKFKKRVYFFIITRQHCIIHFQGLRKITVHNKRDGKPTTK